MRLILLLVLLGGAVGVYGFAGTAEGESPWKWTAAMVGSALAGGGLAAILTFRTINRRNEAGASRDGAESTKFAAEAMHVSAETITDLIEQIRTLQREHSTSLAEMQQVREQLARVEEVARIAAAASAAGRLEEYRDFQDIWDLDQLSFGVVFTLAGGRFMNVNRFFCDTLKCDRVDLLGLGWQRFVAAADLDKTVAEDEAALYRRVWGFRNTWQVKGGGTQRFEWYAAMFGKRHRETIAFAFPIDDEPAVVVPTATARMPIRK